jgi:hypothetical protein
MTRKEIEDQLQTDESKSVGQGEGEYTGHRSGRRIVEIFDKNKSDYTDADLDHTKKVNAYVKRHLGQGPSDDVEHSKRLTAAQHLGRTPSRWRNPCRLNPLRSRRSASWVPT